MPWKNYNLTLSTQKIHPDKISIYMYDIGTYYEFDNWHIEAEYLYKTYAKNSFDDVHAFNAFVNYDLFIKKGLFQKISFLGRYDSMGDHSNGNADEDGKLYITDYSRQRVTGGVDVKALERLFKRICVLIMKNIFMINFLWQRSLNKTSLLWN